MAGLCVSGRIVASRGEARHKLTCRRWLQVERRICLAANTRVLVFSAPLPRMPFLLSLASFSISALLHLFLLLPPSLSAPSPPVNCRAAVKPVHRDKIKVRSPSRPRSFSVFLALHLSVRILLPVFSDPPAAGTPYVPSPYCIHTLMRRHGEERWWMTACVLREHVWQVMRMSLQQTVRSGLQCCQWAGEEQE